MRSLDLKVLDLTTRLPGPLAGAILSDLGAQVSLGITEKGDPFADSDFEPIFKVWAKNFSKNKSRLALDLSQTEACLEKINGFDVVLCPPGKVYEKLSGDLTGTCFIEVIGGKGEQKYLHDLNALFLTKSFQIHLNQSEEVALPYLPIAGVIFAQQIALEVMAAKIERSRGIKKVYLDECVKNVMDKLWDESLSDSKDFKFLHNGKYPCYRIYKTKDGGYVAVAAVESRFWKELVSIFNLNLKLEDRFDLSGMTGQKLSEMFLNYKATEIAELINGRDICVNVSPAKEKE